MLTKPYGYPGGKHFALKQIIPVIPDFREYREPFLGGGSVFVYLRQKYPNRLYWINDLRRELYLFWKQLQTNHEKLIEKIQHFRDNWKDGRALFKYLYENVNNFGDDLMDATAFYVLNRISYGTNGHSFCINNFQGNGRGGRFTQPHIDRLRLYTPLLADVRITNLDYEKVVTTDGEDVFIFLDPPYYTQDETIYGKDPELSKDFDHERFARVMRNVKHKWLITYNDCEEIRQLFSFAQIKEFKSVYCMSSKKAKGHQLFISNYLY